MISPHHPEVRQLGDKLQGALGGKSIEAALSALGVFACFAIDMLPTSDLKREAFAQFVDMITQISALDTASRH